MPKVLVVATSRKTRGGITSVIRAHEQGEQWRKYHCKWIATHIDKNRMKKILIMGSGFIKYLFLLPGSDLVHIHLSEPISAIRKLYFYRLAKLLKKKIIIHFHSFSPDTTINGLHSDVYQEIFTGADAVIVLSNYWKNVVNKRFCLGDKVKVIYNPCPVLGDENIIDKCNSIIYAGTLNQRKGYADLIKAFSKIAKVFPDWKLVLAGNGEVCQARKLAFDLGIADQIVLLGWVSGVDKDLAFRKASVFCLPSYAEGFPMAVLDAWAYGLPVVTTPVGGIPDIAKDGENLLLFNPGDIEALACCLEKLIANIELRNRISAESLHLAATTFNINNINHQLDELYKELTEN